jgi:hypothetical protein
VPRGADTTVELIAAMQRETERRFAENERRLGQLMEAMSSVGRLIEIREQRLDRGAAMKPAGWR